MSVLTYNGITLAMIHTQSVAQVPVKDPSGTDTTHFKITVSVESVFNAGILPTTDGETPAALMKRVRHMLLTPRQSFSFDPTGENLLGVTPDSDVANGPSPVSCDIVSISPKTWVIRYAVEVNVRDCDVGDATLRPWLSLRWSDTLTYNRDWFAVRRRSGTLILSGSDPAGPEAYRGLVTPAVPAGFRRNSAEYALSENNLLVSFRFEDVQLAQVPPRPALTMAGRMIVSTPMPGAKRVGELHLRLSGPPGASKQELLKAAVAVGLARVDQTDIVRGNKGKGARIIGGSVAEEFGDEKNEIELSLQWAINPTAQRNKAAAGDAALGGGFDWVGKPLVDDPEAGKRAIGPPTRGMADAVRLAAVMLNDPCGLAPDAPEEAAAANESVLVGDTGATLTVTPSPGAANNLDPDFQLYSDEEGDYADDGPGTYEVYQITSHYQDDPGVELRPSTKAGGEAVPLQFHAGIRTLTVEFSAEKIGGPPTIPDPRPGGDENAVYVGGTVSPAALDLTADGTSVRYTVSGVYRYQFKNAATVVVAAPLPPWIDRALRLDAGKAASRLAKDIAFPTLTGANPFDGTGTEDVTVIPLGDGAGGDFGATPGGGGLTVYP